MSEKKNQNLNESPFDNSNSNLKFESVFSELEFYKKKSDLLDKDLFKSQTQNKKNDLQIKKLQEMLAQYGKNTNNTSNSFLLPSEFKLNWENLLKDLIMEGFENIYDDNKLLSNLVQDTFKLIYEESLVTIKHKIKTVLESLNILENNTEKFIIRFRSLFQEYFIQIFILDEEFINRIKGNLWEIIDENYKIENKRDEIQNDLAAKGFLEMITSMFKLCVYMHLHDPQLTINIPPYKKRELIYNFYNKSDYCNIEGFGRDQNPCLMILPSPLLRGAFAYQGIKPAVYIESNPTEFINLECKKNQLNMNKIRSHSSQIISNVNSNNQSAIIENNNSVINSNNNSNNVSVIKKLSNTPIINKIKIELKSPLNIKEGVKQIRPNNNKETSKNSSIIDSINNSLINKDLSYIDNKLNSHRNISPITETIESTDRKNDYNLTEKLNNISNTFTQIRNKSSLYANNNKIKFNLNSNVKKYNLNTNNINNVTEKTERNSIPLSNTLTNTTSKANLIKSGNNKQNNYDFGNLVRKKSKIKYIKFIYLDINYQENDNNNNLLNNLNNFQSFNRNNSQTSVNNNNVNNTFKDSKTSIKSNTHLEYLSKASLPKSTTQVMFNCNYNNLNSQYTPLVTEENLITQTNLNTENGDSSSRLVTASNYDYNNSLMNDMKYNAPKRDEFNKRTIKENNSNKFADVQFNLNTSNLNNYIVNKEELNYISSNNINNNQINQKSTDVKSKIEKYYSRLLTGNNMTSPKNNINDIYSLSSNGNFLKIQKNNLLNNNLYQKLKK